MIPPGAADMREKDPKPTQLRQQAEAFLQENPLFAHHRGSENLHEILHELRTAYAELEIQNEELRRAQHDLILSRDKYYELYDFAPIGYCSLDLASTIVEANLALADLLGKPRLHLLKRPLAHFIAAGSHEVLRDMLKNALREEVEQSCQIDVSNDPLKGPRYLRLQCSLTKDGQRIPTGFRLAIIDVSAMVQQERELELLTLTLDSRVQERTGEVERQSEQLRALANDLLKEEQRQRHALATELHDYLAQLLVVASMKTHLLAPLVDQVEARRYVHDLEKILRDAQEYAR
ncbi:MAG: PAS domain S-box protein, partial [Candidatus Hydrogenedentes bacterium]|nr:PAS domain S-box protein [Candidatus Hydrogenedentota bacterium]